jgi:hypothetical protein
MYLDIVVETEMVVSVALQQWQCMLHVEVLKLQDRLGVAPGQRPDQLISDLQIHTQK